MQGRLQDQAPGSTAPRAVPPRGGSAPIARAIAIGVAGLVMIDAAPSEQAIPTSLACWAGISRRTSS